MLVAITQFDESFVNIVTVTFSTLIVIEMLNIMTEVNTLKPKMVFSILLSLLMYFGSIVLFRQYFQVSYIDGTFCIKILILALLAWLPLWMAKKILRKCDPTQE